MTIAYLTQALGCAPRLRDRPPHAFAVGVEPPGSEVVVYEWTGDLVTGPVVSPTTVVIPRSPRPRSYVVRALMAGRCPQYTITSVRDHESTGPGGAPWLLFGPPVSGEAAIVLGSVLVVLLLLAVLSSDAGEQEWEMAPPYVSGRLPPAESESCT